MRRFKCLPLGLAALSVKEVLAVKHCQIAQLYRHILDLLRGLAGKSHATNAKIAGKNYKRLLTSESRKQGDDIYFYLDGKLNAKINIKTGEIETPPYKGRKP